MSDTWSEACPDPGAGDCGPAPPKNVRSFGTHWSEADGQFVGTCEQYPSLSHLANTEAEAMTGILRLVAGVDIGTGQENSGNCEDDDRGTGTELQVPSHVTVRFVSEVLNALQLRQPVSPNAVYRCLRWAVDQHHGQQVHMQRFASVLEEARQELG